MQFASVQVWQDSLDMEARCGSPMEDSWTAGGLACSEVNEDGVFLICLEACPWRVSHSRARMGSWGFNPAVEL